MSLNVGGLYIRVKPRLTPLRVRAAITAYWVERGAKSLTRPPKTIAPLALAKTKQLAFVVMQASDGWICIADSERYTADYALAGFLADKLATQVIWYALYGATDGGVLRVLGGGRKPKSPEDTYGDVEDYVAAKLPHAFAYFDKLEAPDPLVFANVDPAQYDRGPTPSEVEDEPVAFAPASLVDDPESWPVRVPRALVDAGDLRFGYLVAFFMRGPFKQQFAAVERVFERWLSVVPADALRWSRIGANATKKTDFGPKTLDRCRQQLTAKAAAKHVYFEIGGPERTHPQFYFAVSGAETRASDSANDVQIYFPACTPYEVVAKLAHDVAEVLPYATGLVTPALQYDNTTLFARGVPAAARLVARHPGLELQVDGFRLGSTMHGAHWLAFLGPELVAKLGGRKKLEATTGLHSVTVAGHGICLRASERPEVGDVLAGSVPAGLRAMAAIVEPVLAPMPQFARQAGPLQSPQLADRIEDDTLETELCALWYRRFSEVSPRLIELAGALDRLTQLEGVEVTQLDGAALEKYLASLAGVPFVSRALGDQLVVLVHRLVEAGRDTAAERVLAHFPASVMLRFVGYEDRIARLLGRGAKLLPWLEHRRR